MRQRSEEPSLIISLQICTDGLHILLSQEKKNIENGKLEYMLESIQVCGIGSFNDHNCLLSKNSSFIRKILVFYKNSEHISKAKLLRQENMRIKDQPAQSPGPKHGCRKSCCCCFSTGTLQGNNVPGPTPVSSNCGVLKVI